MESKYDLESLIETFGIHAEKNLAQRMIDLELFPDSEYLKDDFCISKALQAICLVLKDLNANE